MSEIKTCPQCAEDVKAKAKICRFCGHAFPEEQPLPPALKVNTDSTATVIFRGRCHSGSTESTNLRMYVYQRADGKLKEIQPVAIAGNGRWRPAGQRVVAHGGDLKGRASVLAEQPVYTTDSSEAGVDEPFQIELLVPAGALEIGWAAMLRAATGDELLDATGCGSVPVNLAEGQTVAIDVGPVLATRGMNSYGMPLEGFSGPPGTIRTQPAVQIATADTDAHSARWCGVEERPPPGGRQVDPLLILVGEHARQRWGHGASVFQANATASGAAFGAKLGANLASKKRKKTLLENARKEVMNQVEQADPGSCTLVEERNAERERATEDLAEVESKLAASEAVQTEWNALTANIKTVKSSVAKATTALHVFSTRIGTAVESDDDDSITVPGIKELRQAAQNTKKLQAEHDALNGASGFFAKAKATAQQVVLKTQITLADTKRAGLRKSVGRAVLETGAEGSAPVGEALKAEIDAARELIAEAQRGLDEAHEARETQRPAFAEQLGVDTLPENGPGSIITALKSKKSAAKSGQKAWLAQTADALIAAGPEQWPANGPLREALDDLAMKEDLL